MNPLMEIFILGAKKLRNFSENVKNVKMAKKWNFSK